MRPLAVITGILLGSSFSIMFSLAAVMIVFLLLGDEHPRLADESRALVGSLFIFTVLTVISAASFYTILKDHAMRWVAQAVMWTGLLATGAYFWP